MRFEQWLYAIPLRLRTLFRRRQVEHELEEELRYHFERQVEQNLARGMSPGGARRAARRAVGRLETHKHECRETWGVAPFDRLAADVSYALRTLRRDRGFTVGVLSLLALGIGANVAVFSIVNGVLLRPLPYAEADRLFVVREAVPELDSRRSVNMLHFLEWQRDCGCFEELALSEFNQTVTIGDGEPERVPAVRVTPNVFPMLGVAAQVGRTLLPHDAEPGADVVVTISDALWRRRYGADPGIVGRTITFDDFPATVVGVLPPGFRHDWGLAPNAPIDVYGAWAVAPMPWDGWSNNYSYAALGRLAEGVSAAAALEELNAIQAAIAADHIDDGLSLRAEILPLREWVTGQSRDGLLLLLAAVGTALLVACLNIANLMLVRATARSREAGVRAALGASRMAIFRGVVVESALLAVTGAAAGVILAAVALKYFALIAPAGLPRIDEVLMDWTALVAAAGFAVLATLAFGLLPALRMTRVDPQDALRANTRAVTGSARGRMLRQALVSVEVALSVGLLIVAGLLVTSFVRLDAVPRGFDSAGVLTALIGLPVLRYGDDTAKLQFFGELLERLENSPGVVAAGLTSALPLTGGSFGALAIPFGEEPPPEARQLVQYRFVSPRYFEAMGIPLLVGRAITGNDATRGVAVVSESTARQLWPQQNPIGRRFWRGNADDVFEVVGLVPDVHSDDLASPPAPLVYAPLTATGGVVFPFAFVVVRASGEPAIAAGTLREVVRALDPELAVSNVQTMAQIEDAALGQRRFQLVLVNVFGAAALMIAALGTYGVLAFTVASRTRELAVRLTLGARESAVRAMVLRQGMRPVLLGLGLGVAAALLFGRFLSGLLYAVEPSDPVTLAAVVGVTLATALLASWLPARRAGRTSLQEALRDE